MTLRLNSQDLNKKTSSGLRWWLTISSEIAKIEAMTNILKHIFPPNLSELYNQKLTNQLAETNGAIGALNQMFRLLQNPTLLMRPILGKEAEASAQLEGTQPSIEDAYKIDLAEQTPKKRNEALEIRNYENAMMTGLDIIKETGFSSLLVREIHKKLLYSVLGNKKNPGKFRTGEVWIGTLGTKKEKARYVPPNAMHVPQLMEQLQGFAKNRNNVHPLLACGIIHHRFEAIHPFEDGNGRTGRLLITLYLVHEKLLTMPILYPSGYFEKNRNEYINALSGVDKKEDWYTWLLYFLKGLQYQANLSLDIALKIDALLKRSRFLIEKERANINLIRVLEATFSNPFITSASLNNDTKIPRPSCDRYLKTLVKHDIIKDMGIYKKERVFANQKLLELLRSI